MDVSGLVAGYHLREGRSAIVADFSGHGNTGTLKGQHHAGQPGSFIGR